MTAPHRDDRRTSAPASRRLRQRAVRVLARIQNAAQGTERRAGFRTVPRDRTSLLGALDAARGLGWLLTERRPRPAVVEARLGPLDEAQRRSTARRYVG